ncbi:MAG: 6-phosphogluconolactonase [Paludibacteraceae bacterium]
MLRNKILVFDNPEHVATSVAKIIVEKINNKKGIFNLAISGGNTPKILFDILAKQYSDTVRWDKLNLFWVDERCVEPSDKESNYGMVYNTLLTNIPIPPENIFRMQGERQPETESVHYQKILNKTLPKHNNLPFFDLVLLGMGEDGHTASIFPYNILLLYSEQTVAVATHPNSGQKRITLTGNTIKNSRQIFFLITGESKEETLKQIITEAKEAEKYPAYHILSTTKAEVFTDKGAFKSFYL